MQNYRRVKTQRGAKLYSWVECIALGSCDIPGTLISNFGIAPRTTPSCLNTYQPVCGDCTTLWKCENSANPPTINCKAAYPDRPHCNEGGCTATQSAECVVSEVFRCTDAGYFPDPQDCTKYHLCAAAGATDGAVATYKCPNGYTYNTETTLCKLNGYCYKVNCTGDPFGYTIYPGNYTFYASCRGDDVPWILRCPKLNVFSVNESKCVFQCPFEGRIADPDSQLRYYECYLEGNTYYYTREKCVDGYLFDQGSQQCFKPAPPMG
ncbi:hypothetical protein Bhyg_01386 [Pseudolycoriella hygida]|uniref:Chitin-binding type-2 domain-containing protein n=1 Tax=Pseudolycoriella hygida TaxID=35572 RepID=A0A9Q0S7C0_9DIPT|nr:hypothetical protein Bhyg_01386 [Pseudolycoriella hygida]